MVIFSSAYNIIRVGVFFHYVFRSETVFQKKKVLRLDISVSQATETRYSYIALLNQSVKPLKKNNLYISSVKQLKQDITILLCSISLSSQWRKITYISAILLGLFARLTQNSKSNLKLTHAFLGFFFCLINPTSS